ncbi:hypothetical protein NIES2100_20010 [Calothrix sp. NIES-2100]|uniref:DUF928 domain-containing protein n=1 Tax=Calothrix sp. NIES-2100 TaxID=1954172 RepID=UPI000B61D34C|nr:hypothetical protein NIES2100_20010 [Calothrix sp. NIES-2100]
MSKYFCLIHQFLTNKLLLSCTFILYLTLTTTAIATYKPPANPSSPRTPTGSNSSRTNECTGNEKTSLTALAPVDYIGQTVSLQPIFAWFVPNSPSRDIEFRLYEYVNGKPQQVVKTIMQSSPGIMTYSFANKQINLAVGQKYVWQVALLCNPNHPSEDLIVRANIEVVAIPPKLKNQLLQTKELGKRSDLYAEQGFWYDALAETLNNSANKASTFKLLAELSQLEKQEASRKGTDPNLKQDLEQQALRLQEIIAAEQELK